MALYVAFAATVLLSAVLASPAREVNARSEAYPTSCDTTLCVDGVSDCGEPFGGCVPYCEGDPFPTFTTSPCPTSTPTLEARAKKPTQIFTETDLEVFPTIINDVVPCPTVCVDKVNKCGLRYGGCAERCDGKPLPSFSEPPCQTTTKKASCTTKISPATIACNPILKPGQFGVPYQYTYPLPTTSCSGKHPSSTPKRDYQDCPKTTSAPKVSKKTASCKTSTITASVMCDPILGPGEFGVPTQSAYQLPVTSCPGKAPSSTPRRDYTDCPKTKSKRAPEPTPEPKCQTILVDAAKDCTSTSIPFGYEITSCSGKKPSSTVDVPKCPKPTCETLFVDGFKDCTTTSIGFGGPATLCPGKSARSTWTSPSCPTKTAH
ncbi:MAG: hypothetical protein MMC23_007211 [Stictis urceolatum]|nr:hypothetical protein [Stictis urceolata]